MKSLNTHARFEFVISLACTLIALILSIIFSDQIIAAIIAGTTTIVSIQNIANIFRDSKNNLEIEDEIHNIKSVIENSSKYIHINELEKIEHEFCEGTGKNATIYIASNNLTNDKRQFIDEIKLNIKNGVNYIYVVSDKYTKAAEQIKYEINKSLLNQTKVDINRQFKIYTSENLFKLCPQKYTIVIYDKDLSAVCTDNLKGFCCAQDNTNYGIFYFTLSYDYTKIIKDYICKEFDSIEKGDKVKHV